MGIPILRFWFLVSCLMLPSASVANPVHYDHINVELIAEVTSVRPGEPFWVALKLQPEEAWYTYWRNPGDTGLPPSIEWDLPAGSQASEVLWPYPQRFAYQGMVSYGYKGETLLLTQITPPSVLDSSAPFTVITASAYWLVCKEACIPGNAELSLELPISESEPNYSRWRSAFAVARARIPVNDPAMEAAFTLYDRQLYLQVNTPAPLFTDDVNEITFFPRDQEIVANSAPQDVRWDPSTLNLRQQQSEFLRVAPETLRGVLVVKTTGGESAYALSASSTLVADPMVFDPMAERRTTTDTAAGSLVFVILSAVLGGILLNLMPCVFPVLSLKAISLLESAEMSHRVQRLHGIAYALGAVVFFALVASGLLLLKATGASVGWGFQLQSPWFVALLAYLLFVMALSFSGVMEVGTSLMGVGQNLTNRAGYGGSFFTGALAAVVASPCTAPFMGTAIAVALSQPVPIALSVFIALGFGMALPFLLISFLPGLVRLLPRPGPWMATLRQFMAFPLYITVIWLLWVLGRQTDASGMAAAMGGMLLLAFAIWLLKLRAHTEGRWRRLAESFMVVATLGAFGILHLPLLNEPALNLAHVATSQSTWEPYKDARLTKALADGKPVFINMTADWCISCIANERVALSFPGVREAFQEKEVVLLKGDWTSRNADITKVLHRFGREGVPLYVLYSPRPGAEPMVLPQFLTPNIVLEALDTVAGDSNEKPSVATAGFVTR